MMRHKLTLSYAFNMSLGFIPAIIAIVLCGILPYSTAVYIGTGFGILYSIYIAHAQVKRAPNLLLYISTGTLAVFALLSLIPGNKLTNESFPITLETSMIIIFALLYLQRKKIADHFRNRQERLLCQSVESCVVAMQVIMALGVIHLFVIVMGLLFGRNPMRPHAFYAIYHVMPWAVFAVGIVFNQMGIHYFNRVARKAIILPVVNKRGDVIGRSLASETLTHKNKHINPVVRVAIMTNGMLFLCRRAQTRILDRGKIDVPMERYLRFGETLEECAVDLVQSTFPNAKEHLKPTFSVVYHFENDITNRLTYLFILDVKDDVILCDPRFEGGKLWTVGQVDTNLGKDFFGSCLEEEFEHLKVVIDTKEKYKVS